MPYSNTGDQNILISYGEDITDKSINRRFEGLVPTGIYEGLELTKIGSNSISVAPGLVHIGDGRGERVKIRVQASVDISSVTPSSNFIAVQWEYRADEGWYARIDSFGAVSGHMILLGEALFDANDNINDIDFRDRGIITYKKGVEVRNRLITHGARIVDFIEVTSDSFSAGLEGRSFGVRTDQLSSNSTFNLPTGTDLQNGREVEVADIGGNAGTHSISVSAGSNESVEGSSSKDITTDFGSKTFRYYNSVSEWVEI